MLNRKTFLIKEHVGLLKLSNTYDILDPATQEHLGIAQERPGIWIHLLRLLVSRAFLPTQVFVYEGNNPEDASKLKFSIHKGVAIFRPRVEILDASGMLLGFLQRKKLISLSSFFDVFDAKEQQVAAVKGNWVGWDFKFNDMQGVELGQITKKWTGFAKEFFTTADQYVIDLKEEANPALAILFLAAGLAVDTVYKEKN